MQFYLERFSFPIYGILLILSMVIGVSYYLFLLRKSIKLDLLVLLGLVSIAFMIFCGKLFTIISGTNELNIFKIGLSSYGGVFGLLLSSFCFGKIYGKEQKKIFVCSILVLPLIYSIGKLGCFLVGCCHGILYDGIFSVTYGDISGISYFPVQLVESIIFLILFIIAIVLYFKKNPYVGEMVVCFCSFSKGMLDFLRYGHVGFSISINQVVSLLLFCVSIFLIFKKRKRLMDTKSIFK